jgi:predicted nucleic acid-binding protein
MRISISETRPFDVFLVDTNVISDARKGVKANHGVRAFWRSADPASFYVAVQTIGEIRRGVENIRNRGDAAQAGKLDAWLDMIVEHYADRILDFDLDCSQVWGRLMSPNPQHAIDKQIAAIALIHDLTVVTRNVADFGGLGVRLMNPFR